MEGLVFNFTYATVVTFTSAVGKPNLRVLHHMLCQVFVKSYNFVFKKMNIEYAPHQMWQKSRRLCIHAARIVPPLTCT